MREFYCTDTALQGAPDREGNEDFYVCTPQFIAVFDGVTVPRGTGSGCIHGTSWLVERIAGFFTSAVLTGSRKPLPNLLRDAIAYTADLHRGTCDLTHPGTPSTTITALRLYDEVAEYVILADSPLLVDLSGEMRVITDDRVSRSSHIERDAILKPDHPLLPQERAESIAALSRAQRPYRNTEGGYWLAAATPEAAQHAVTGTFPLTGEECVTRVALLTDGASAAVETLELYTWEKLLLALAHSGSETLLDEVRARELSDPECVTYPRIKAHDDACVVYAKIR